MTAGVAATALFSSEFGTVVSLISRFSSGFSRTSVFPSLSAPFSGGACSRDLGAGGEGFLISVVESVTDS